MSAPIWDIVAGHDGTISDGAPWQAVKALALMRRKPIISRALGGLVILAMAGFCLSASARAQSRHADTELEALLPTTLGGVALTIESQAGSELATNNAAFDSFLAGLGKTRSDFTLASAYSRGQLKAEVGAWRVKDANPVLLLPEFQAAVQASSTILLTRVDEMLAGRKITRIGNPGQLTRGPLYVIVRQDALLFVQTTEPALAEEAMRKLPK
jgi:hypothetical protein